jgi:hypothetical protein
MFHTLANLRISFDSINITAKFTLKKWFLNAFFCQNGKLDCPTQTALPAPAMNWRKNLQYCHEIRVGTSYDKGRMSTLVVLLEPCKIIV